MSWAAQRRFFILIIVGAVVAALLVTVGIATFYEAPSCSDRVQNGEEAGVDCGGPCAYLCIEQQQPPTVLFTKALQNGAGRIDVVAEVENKNASAAAEDVPYTITLYGAGQTLIQKVSGKIDLPPGARVPVFVPGISSGKQTVVHAFLDIVPSAPQWFALSKDPRRIPVVSNIQQIGTLDAPRIEAVMKNPGVTALSNIKTVVLVHNDKGDVIAASTTVVPTISGQGTATAIFTWNEAFSSVPAAIEVIPIIPLPDR